MVITSTVLHPSNLKPPRAKGSATEVCFNQLLSNPGSLKLAFLHNKHFGRHAVHKLFVVSYHTVTLPHRLEPLNFSKSLQLIRHRTGSRTGSSSTLESGSKAGSEQSGSNSRDRAIWSCQGTGPTQGRGRTRLSPNTPC